MHRVALSVLSVAVFSGCIGEIFGPTGSSDGPPPERPGTTTVTPPPATPVPAVQDLRRLTRQELDDSLSRLIGDGAHRALAIMPGEQLEPFDNATDKQRASAVWIEAAEQLADETAAAVMADPTRRAALVGCSPSGSADMTCLASFTRSFGRRVLRRPLTDAEVTEFMNLTPVALERGDFWTAAEVVLRRLLQDPEFLFRVESPSDLSQYEIASRLSFFLQGATPPDWLLDSADRGELATPDQRRAAGRKLIDEPLGRAHVLSFHAMWLGYTSLPHTVDLNAAMTAETNALVKKVVLDDRADYRTLFTADSTWVNATLAAHYGLSVPVAGSAWVPYGSSGRKGILSHGALLSNGVKQSDTSPTLRGKWIRNRLFCEEIPPPPPNVTADVPPPSTGGLVCKKDRYQVHDMVQSCAGCHTQMDPIGFGLEQFDRAGKFRTAEESHPECLITGEGSLTGFGSFRGAAGLADLMVSSGTVETCVVKQVFRYSTGRREQGDDAALLAALTTGFTEKGRKFDELLLDVVSHPVFAQRRETP
ncbi:MAG: DUF1588 domain-containing protein [Myxococcaceae bacterium]